MRRLENAREFIGGDHRDIAAISSLHHDGLAIIGRPIKEDLEVLARLAVARFNHGTRILYKCGDLRYVERARDPGMDCRGPLEGCGPQSSGTWGQGPARRPRGGRRRRRCCRGDPRGGPRARRIRIALVRPARVDPGTSHRGWKRPPLEGFGLGIVVVRDHHETGAGGTRRLNHLAGRPPSIGERGVDVNDPGDAGIAVSWHLALDLERFVLSEADEEDAERRE